MYSLGWRYLSNAACLMRPRLFDECFVVRTFVIRFATLKEHVCKTSGSCNLYVCIHIFIHIHTYIYIYSYIMNIHNISYKYTLNILYVRVTSMVPPAPRRSWRAPAGAAARRGAPYFIICITRCMIINTSHVVIIIVMMIIISYF